MEHGGEMQYLKLIKVVDTTNICPFNFKYNKAIQSPLQFTAKLQRIP